MKNRARTYLPIVIVILAVVLLPGCLRSTAPTPVPDLAYTQAAETIVAQLTQAAPQETLPPEAEVQISTATPTGIAEVTEAPTEPPVIETTEAPLAPRPTESEAPIVVPITPLEPAPTTAYQFPTAIPLGGVSALPSATPVPTVVPVIPMPMGVFTSPPPQGFPTAIPLLQITATQIAPMQLPLRTIFTDDFSNHFSWTVDEGTNWKLRFDRGGYRMAADFVKDAMYSVKTADSYSDVRLEVDATRLGGPANSYYGLTCRFQNGSNYYGFVVSGDGTFAILKKETGKIVFLAESPAPSPIIHYGNTPNRIRADCFGNTLALYVDNYLLLAVQDNTFLSGFTGMLVGNRENPGIDVVFDNFALMIP